MEFGTFYEMQRGNDTYDADLTQRLFTEAVEQITFTEALGFDSAWASEHHHLGGYSSSSSPETFLGYVAARTNHIRLGYGVGLLSCNINHPWRIAERVAVLDILSNGRVEAGCGRGITKEELAAFDDNIETSRQVQIDMMRMLPHMWVQDTFSWESDHFRLPPTSLEPRPIQQPHPPMHLACQQPTSWELAGRLGMGAMCFAFLAGEMLQKSIAIYREAQKQSEAPYLQNNKITMGVIAYCAETDEEAVETLRPGAVWHMERSLALASTWASTNHPDFAFYRKMAESNLGLDLDLQEGETPAAALYRHAINAGLFCVGSPQTCAKWVRQKQNEGIDQVLFMTQVAGLEHEKIQRSHELLAKNVLPEFRPNPIKLPVEQPL